MESYLTWISKKYKLLKTNLCKEKVLKVIMWNKITSKEKL
jgi:hypothetical protein